MASMAVNELGPMLTATEVAEMLHLHVNTVKRLGDRGELPFYRVCKRGDRRFRLDDVMKFLRRTAKRHDVGAGWGRRRPPVARFSERPVPPAGARCCPDARGRPARRSVARDARQRLPEDLDRLADLGRA